MPSSSLSVSESCFHICLKVLPFLLKQHEVDPITELWEKSFIFPSSLLKVHYPFRHVLRLSEGMGKQLYPL